MALVGIIAEYDPFHAGHAYQLRQAKALSGAEMAVVVMSGSFTQRGAPAILTPHARAEMALRCGADAVFSLPYSFAVREAEHFALGGVYLLTQLGATHISFGCETPDLHLLQAAARLLEHPSDAFTAALRAAMDQGRSYAAAQGLALTEILGPAAEALSRPNNTLAVCYLRAILRLNSPLIPVPVLREGDYHSDQIAALSSATAIRAALFSGRLPDVRGAMPEAAFAVLQREMDLGRLCQEEAMDKPLLASLLVLTPEQAAAAPEISEGLENRILANAMESISRADLILRVKTRRYPYTRISRALCHLATGTTRAMLPALPEYTRLLGFNAAYRPYFSRVHRDTLEVFSNPADARSPSAALDLRADRLWSVLCGCPAALTCRAGCITL